MAMSLVRSCEMFLLGSNSVDFFVLGKKKRRARESKRKFRGWRFMMARPPNCPLRRQTEVHKADEYGLRLRLQLVVLLCLVLLYFNLR